MLRSTDLLKYWYWILTEISEKNIASDTAYEKYRQYLRQYSKSIADINNPVYRRLTAPVRTAKLTTTIQICKTSTKR